MSSARLPKRWLLEFFNSKQNLEIERQSCLVTCFHWKFQAYNQSGVFRVRKPKVNLEEASFSQVLEVKPGWLNKVWSCWHRAM